MVLPTSEPPAVSQTPKLLRFATLLTFEEKISSQHFTAFLVQKTQQKNLENLFIRNLFRLDRCKIVIGTTVTYVMLRTHALVDTCYMSSDLAGTRKNDNFDLAVRIESRLVTPLVVHKMWATTGTPGCRSRR